MKKTVVRPFEAGSLMLALVGFAFPAMLIYEAVSSFSKDWRRSASSLLQWRLCLHIL